MSDLQDHIVNLRRDYASGRLDRGSVDPDPFRQFDRWMSEALKSDISDANAMTLATADAHGQPSTRVVLLRGMGPRGFRFFTNYESRKGHELEVNPKAALNFLWLELERQVGIQGTVEKLPAADSNAYFLSRPRNNRLGAWASPQSQEIPNRAWLEQRVDEWESKFGQSEGIERPPHWGGYVLVPHYIEFWQGRASRLHDRIAYRLQADGSWNIARLAP